MSANEKLVLSVKETAEVLGVSRQTVYNLIHSSDFPVIKLGGRTLIAKAELQQWISSRVRGAANE